MAHGCQAHGLDPMLGIQRGHVELYIVASTKGRGARSPARSPTTWTTAGEAGTHLARTGRRPVGQGLLI